MVFPLFALAMAPAVYWDKGPDTATQLKKAGIEQVYVPSAQDRAAWTRAGLTAMPLDNTWQTQAQKVPKPGLRYKLNQSGPTAQPWVDSNGWRFERGLKRADYADLPAGAAALAAAEAHMYGVEALLHPQAEDLTPLGSMLHFLAGLPAGDTTARANIRVVDDGTPLVGEILNLLTRHNLLYRVASTAAKSDDLVVQLGSSEFPKEEARDPYHFADHVRNKLSDDKRLVRIYNTTATIVRLSGTDQRPRLHLLNYADRPVQDVRIRVLGRYAQAPLRLNDNSPDAMLDYSVDATGTEFTIPSLPKYAIVDLTRIP